MSLLMFTLAPEGALVMTDTLATTPAGDPHLLVTKCGIVPHLNLVMAGTGVAQLTERWRNTVYSHMLCRDIDMLNVHAPAALRDIWMNAKDEFPDAVIDPSATVYHLGFSEPRREYVGYAYRSTNGFTPEEMGPGFRVKPQPQTPLTEPPAEIDEWINLAQRLREEQSAFPKETRVHIGGDLVFIVLQQGAILVRKVHRFEDFEPMWLEMNVALSP
jgi:hypothetical protein